MTYEEQIEEIMDYFDFGRVAKTMEVLNWRWASSDGVPNEGELRRTARQLLRAVAKEGPDSHTGTGGFYARNDKWNCLSLDFVVSGWRCEPEVD